MRQSYEVRLIQADKKNTGDWEYKEQWVPVTNAKKQRNGVLECVLPNGMNLVAWAGEWRVAQ